MTVVADQAGLLPERPSYDGRLGDFTRLVLWTTLLSWLTLFFYRFWGRTRLRRYLWSRVTFMGDRVEYTGTGGELFRGFVIAAVAVVLVFGSLTLLEEVLLSDPAVIAVVRTFHYALLFLGALLGRFFARRYRLTRTRWRGLRGNLGDALGGYVGRYVGWWILAAATLGILTPVLRVSLERHLLNHTWIGNQRLACEARAGGLIGPWLLCGLLSCIAIALAIALAAAVLDSGVIMTLSGILDLGWIKGGGAVVVGLVLAIPLVMLAYGGYCIAELRTLVNGTRLGDARLTIDLDISAIVGPILAYSIPLAIMILAGGVAALAFVDDTMAGARLPAILTAVGAFGVWRVASVVVWSHALAARLVPSVAVIGTLHPERLLQNTGPVPRRGEGLAEMFDVAG